MPTARQAPQFTLRAGPGLALIEDLRRLRDWYLALCHHRQIVDEDARKENNMFVVTDTSGNPFEDALQHRGSTIYYDGSGDMNDPANYYVGDSAATLEPLAPSRMRHRGGSGPSSAIYNHPPASPRDRPPYKLPRPIGLVLKAELIDFHTWATCPGLGPPSTSPPAAPAKPKPKGLALRADLIALAEQLAAG